MLLENVGYTSYGARACKHVSGSEPFALGHYAGNPIFPGVQSLQLMLELSGGLLRLEGKGAPRRTRITRTQYLDVIRPGDVLEIEVEFGKRDEAEIRINARINAGGVLKTRGTFDYEFHKE